MKKLIAIIFILTITVNNLKATNDGVIEYDISILSISNGEQIIYNNDDINTEDYIIIGTKEKQLSFTINSFSLADEEYFEDCSIKEIITNEKSTTYSCIYDNTKLVINVEENNKRISIEVPEKNAEVIYEITKITKY